MQSAANVVGSRPRPRHSHRLSKSRQGGSLLCVCVYRVPHPLKGVQHTGSLRQLQRQASSAPLGENVRRHSSKTPDRSFYDLSTVIHPEPNNPRKKGSPMCVPRILFSRAASATYCYCCCGDPNAGFLRYKRAPPPFAVLSDPRFCPNRRFRLASQVDGLVDAAAVHSIRMAIWWRFGFGLNRMYSCTMSS